MISQRKTILWEKSYQESDKVLQNPIRGFYGLSNYNLSEPFIDNGWVDEYPVQLVVLNIGAFAGCDISANALFEMQKIFDFYRNNQKDLILRIVYDSEGKGMEKEPAIFSRVLKHLEQIGPVLRSNKDIIWVFQGVLLGSWGEMHSSKFLQKEKLMQIENLLENYLGTECVRSVRKPEYMKMLSSTNVENQKREIKNSRLALFNDGMFGSETDLFTFSRLEEKEEELDYIYEVTRGLPNGGELLLADGYRPDEGEMISHLKKLRISYLNRYHDMAFFERLENEKPSLLSFIENHMGYRYVVTSSKAYKEEEEKNLFFSVEIINTGFSEITQEAEICILHKNQIVYKEDIHKLENKKEEMRISCTFRLPNKKGEYFLFMQRKKDGRRIQFANSEEENGRILLGRV